MDETLRVKIVADTTQATSSMKTLNKETGQLGSGTNAASAAVDKLDKALNSVGFRSIRIKAIADTFKQVKQETIKTGSAIKNSFSSSSFRKFGESLRIAKTSMDDMSKKAPAATGKIKAAMDAISEARNKAKASGSILDASGLPKIRQAIEDLANAEDKTIRRVFNSSDFDGLRDGLLKASRAAAKGSKDEFIEAISRMDSGIMLNALTEDFDNSVRGMFDRFKTRSKNAALQFKQAFTTAIGTVKKLIKGLLIGGLVTGVIGGIAAIKNAFSVSELGDSIDKTSQKVGMSTTAFQKWGYVLERCGLEATQLQTAMRALTRNSMGNNADYFRQLGIEPNGLSQQQLFEKTVKALQNISDSTQRARVAYKLFGQSSAELAPLLAISNAEVQRLTYQYDLLGAAMSGKVVRASVDMRDAITDLKAAFQGLKNTLAQAIIPLITKLVIRLTVFIAKINMILQALFGVDMEYASVEESAIGVTKQAEKTNTAVKKLKTLISGFDELNIFPSKDNGAELGSFLDDLADYGSDVAPVIGNILPPEAIAELENFRDNVLPKITEKINELKEKWNLLKEAFQEGDFLNFLHTFLDVTGLSDIPIVSKIMEGLEKLKTWWDEHIGGNMIGWDPIDWDSLFNPDDLWDFLGLEIEEDSIFDKIRDFFDDVKEWENVDFFVGWEIPDNIFGNITNLIDKLSNGEWPSLGEWLKGIFGEVDFDFENSPVGRLVHDIGEWDIWKKEWWSEKWENFKKNINPSYWWNGDEQTIGLKEMLGFDKIEGWDIWKKEWWQNLFSKGPEAGTNVGVTSLTGSIEESWKKIKQWWNTNVSPKFTSSFWQGKFQTASIGLTGVNIPAKVAAVWGTITSWWNTNVKPKFTASYWQTKFNSIKDGLGNMPILQKVKDTWTSVQNWWFGKIQPKFTMTYWKEKFNTIRDGLGYASILTSIKEKWISVKSWWDSSVAPKFTWTYWRDKFNSIRTGLNQISLTDVAKRIINGLISTIESGLNWIIRKVNNSGILTLLRNIGVNAQLNEIYIPRLAKGGVIDQPTVAQLGEYPGAKSNPEIVTPENKLTQIFESSNNDIVDVLVQGFRQIIEAIEEKDTSVTIGDTVIAKSAARGNKQYRLQTGQSLF